MAVRILLDNPPEFYTNMDTVSGRIQITVNRTETIGAIVVKLEGESTTAVRVGNFGENSIEYNTMRRVPPSAMPTETHKVLYKIEQAFPPLSESNQPVTAALSAGRHDFKFMFRLPFNNACSDTAAMANLGGIAGVGGFGSGLRVMDGSKQLFLRHVHKTLPPSLTGFPGLAEIRYYVKVTVQRPGLLKENWRSHIGFRFMPIEEPRPPPSTSLAFARRPFAFSPRKRRALSSAGSSGKGLLSSGNSGLDEAQSLPPTVEVSALLPHPTILTCNKPIPLRIVATKKMPSTEPVYLVALEISLIGHTDTRCHELSLRETNRWIVCAASGLSIPVTGDPEADVGSEITVPDDLWRNIPLPNTVHPSFVTCNIARSYELEIRVGLSRDLPQASSPSAATSFTKMFKGTAKESDAKIPMDTIMLPLRFTKLQVFSGIAPSSELLSQVHQRQSQVPPQRTSASSPSATLANGANGSLYSRPALPPRRPNTQSDPAPAYDPLYPPQIGTPADATYEAAPPSYEDAMAETVAGPFENAEARPAYSGMTDVNGPSQVKH
ncbi:hypothetical protein TD95_005079 [Thielaviopsis punctulata]|uniref:Arrestin-like N-terminal domain-containing protein n=1 Tax=Thielaviopsis punctulata TaxID=72032 RepID=A0A0F4ZKP4_9PEZI|nr:hypothetical protein TD95_005079 [Thielaviopsis punctulata]